MAIRTTARALLSLATLRETRRRLATRRGRGLVAGIAVAYAFVSMLVGSMLILEPIGGDYFWMVLWSGNGTHAWDYPGLLVVGSWGILSLPLFPTVAMIVVSIGVGIGGAAAVVLLLPWLRRLTVGSRRTATAGAAAGMGPAVTGLATLGACCCTTCAGAAGISVVAATSGTTLSALLVNDWYIGAFQMVVVAVSLLAQERAFRLTGPACPVPPPFDRRFAAGAALRLGLLIAGVTWSLAMLVEWGTTDPLTAGPGLWYHWILEHQLLALLAVGAALFPQELARAFRALGHSFTTYALRVALAVAGVTWAIGVPPTLVSAGLGGLVNEMLGYAGVGAAWGAVPPDSPLGWALVFHWLMQHLFLGAFALAVAVDPRRALAPLLWSTPAPRVGVGRDAPASRDPAWTPSIAATPGPTGPASGGTESS